MFYWVEKILYGNSKDFEERVLWGFACASTSLAFYTSGVSLANDNFVSPRASHVSLLAFMVLVRESNISSISP